MNLSVHTLLGACYEPAGLTEPVTQYGVSYSRFYFTAPASALFNAASDPFIRKFVRFCNHSHHEHFIDSRHISSTAFLRQVSSGRYSGLLSADFTELLTAILAGAASRRSEKMFQGVTPSFHLSVHQFPNNSLYLILESELFTQKQVAPGTLVSTHRYRPNAKSVAVVLPYSLVGANLVAPLAAM